MGLLVSGMRQLAASKITDRRAHAAPLAGFIFVHAKHEVSRKFSQKQRSAECKSLRKAPARATLVSKPGRSSVLILRPLVNLLDSPNALREAVNGIDLPETNSGVLQISEAWKRNV